MNVNIPFEARIYTEDGHLRFLGRITSTPYPGTQEIQPEPLDFEIWRAEAFRDGFLHYTFLADDPLLFREVEEHFDAILLQAEEAFAAVLPDMGDL